MLPEHEFTTETVPLKSGDGLIMFTDGATEPHNAADEEFGVKRLIDIALRKRTEPDDLIDEIESEIAEFTGHAPMFDDFTVVALAAD
jgi:serine phosphatase RsbU (regulator of sigma subunit)